MQANLLTATPRRSGARCSPLSCVAQRPPEPTDEQHGKSDKVPVVDFRERTAWLIVRQRRKSAKDWLRDFPHR